MNYLRTLLHAGAILATFSATYAIGQSGQWLDRLPSRPHDQTTEQQVKRRVIRDAAGQTSQYETYETLTVPARRNATGSNVQLPQTQVNDPPVVIMGNPATVVNCADTTENRTIACTPPLVGDITQRRNFVCGTNGTAGTWGDWYDVSNTCCNPDLFQERLVGCPVGYTGIITQRSYMQCPAGLYGEWTTTGNTCAATCQPRTETTSDQCASGYEGYIRYTRNVTCSGGTEVFGAWTTSENTCTLICRAEQETRTIACNDPTFVAERGWQAYFNIPVPWGGTWDAIKGVAVQQRTRPCSNAAWTAWQTISTATCVPNCPTCGWRYATGENGIPDGVSASDMAMLLAWQQKINNIAPLQNASCGVFGAETKPPTLRTTAACNPAGKFNATENWSGSGSINTGGGCDWSSVTSVSGSTIYGTRTCSSRNNYATNYTPLAGCWWVTGPTFAADLKVDGRYQCQWSDSRTVYYQGVEVPWHCSSSGLTIQNDGTSAYGTVTCAGGWSATGYVTWSGSTPAVGVIGTLAGSTFTFAPIIPSPPGFYIPVGLVGVPPDATGCTYVSGTAYGISGGIAFTQSCNTSTQGSVNTTVTLPAGCTLQSAWPIANGQGGVGYTYSCAQNYVCQAPSLPPPHGGSWSNVVASTVGNCGTCTAADYLHYGYAERACTTNCEPRLEYLNVSRPDAPRECPVGMQGDPNGFQQWIIAHQCPPQPNPIPTLASSTCKPTVSSQNCARTTSGNTFLYRMPAFDVPCYIGGTSIMDVYYIGNGQLAVVPDNSPGGALVFNAVTGNTTEWRDIAGACSFTVTVPQPPPPQPGPNGSTIYPEYTVSVTLAANNNQSAPVTQTFKVSGTAVPARYPDAAYVEICTQP